MLEVHLLRKLLKFSNEILWVIIREYHFLYSTVSKLAVQGMQLLRCCSSRLEF